MGAGVSGKGARKGSAIVWQQALPAGRRTRMEHGKLTGRRFEPAPRQFESGGKTLAGYSSAALAQTTFTLNRQLASTGTTSWATARQSAVNSPVPPTG